MHTFQDPIFPYLLKEYLIFIIDFLALTVLALFLVLIIHKLYTEKRNRRKKRFTDEYRAVLAQCLADGSPLPQRPGSALAYAAFADVCVDLLAKAQGGAEKRIRALLKESAAVEYFTKLAASSSWSKRFYAMEMLGFFMIDELRGLFKGVLDVDKSPEVRAKAIWSLSLIADKEDLGYLSRKLSAETVNSSKFNVYVFSNLISSFRKKGLAGFVVKFLGNVKEDETVPPVIKRDIIEACGATGLTESAAMIHDYFSYYRHDILIRIACIRALGPTGGLDAGTTLTGLSDIDWRMRAVSAKALYEYDDVIISRLQEMLYDPVYAVRINAARKLAGLGDSGVSALKNEVNSKDRFVRETTAFILEAVYRGEMQYRDKFVRPVKLSIPKVVPAVRMNPAGTPAGTKVLLLPGEKAKEHV